MKRFFILVFVLFSFAVKAQETTQSSPRKIGLVLSGGGAKGFAHVGILKVIDSLGIKLDYIGGTSMGAAMGALYASGYSGKQIDSIIMNIDFMEMLTDDISRDYTSFFQKEHQEKYLVTFPVRNFKPDFPIALSKGQSTVNKLTELFDHVSHIRDFSQLPVPFFCVGTDIETGDEVEFNNGFLPLAVRSSASLPTLLSPNYYQGKNFIDGGIANNFPIDNIKAKGVDYVIGVDVQGSLKSNETINSALNVVDQIVNFQLYGKEYKDSENLDLLLQPEIKEFSVVGFDKKRELIDLGEKKALAHIDELRKLSSQAYVAPKKIVTTHLDKEYTIKNIEIKGRKFYTRRYLLGKLKLKISTKISIRELNKKINSLTLSNNIERLDYRFLRDEKTNTVKIVFNVIENKDNRFVRFGAHYDPLYKTSLLFNFTNDHLIQRNDIFSLDVVLGDNVRYDLNYFVDNGHDLSYGFRSYSNRFETTTRPDITDENRIISRINLTYTDITNYLFLQSNFHKKFAIRVGIEHKNIENYTTTFDIPNTTDDRTFYDDSNYLNVLGSLKLDSYDKKAFPNKGFLVDATFRSFLRSSDFNNRFEPFNQVRVKLEGIRTLSNRFSLWLQGDGALSFIENKSGQFEYALGGYGKSFINNFVEFHGYEFANEAGNSFVKTSASIRYRVYKEIYLDFLTNYAIVKEDVLDFLKDESFFNNAISGSSIGLGVNTLLGPLDVRYVWSEDTDFSRFYIGLGFWF